jgi:hypothetical protein
MGPDVLDAQLRERPAGLGGTAAVDFAAGFRRVKVMRAPDALLFVKRRFEWR